MKTQWKLQVVPIVSLAFLALPYQGRAQFTFSLESGPQTTTYESSYDAAASQTKSTSGIGKVGAAMIFANTKHTSGTAATLSGDYTLPFNQDSVSGGMTAYGGEFRLGWRHGIVTFGGGADIHRFKEADSPNEPRFGVWRLSLPVFAKVNIFHTGFIQGGYYFPLSAETLSLNYNSNTNGLGVPPSIKVSSSHTSVDIRVQGGLQFRRIQLRGGYSRRDMYFDVTDWGSLTPRPPSFYDFHQNEITGGVVFVIRQSH